jgi:hypothetical protein
MKRESGRRIARFEVLVLTEPAKQSSSAALHRYRDGKTFEIEDSSDPNDCDRGHVHRRAIAARSPSRA